MIDIRLVREQPQYVKANLAKRGDPELIKKLEQLIEADSKWRAGLKKIEQLRAEKNDIEIEIAKKKRAGAKIDIEKLKKVTEKIAVMERQNNKYKNMASSLLMRIPNLLHESVPVGRSEEDNQEVRRWGKLPEFEFEPKGHEEIGLAIGGLEIERAAKISGSRFYFLKGPLVLLEQALIKFSLDWLIKAGFEPVSPPLLMKREPYEGVTDLADFETVMYKIEGEDLYTIATSEHPIAAMYSKEVIPEDLLPIKFVGLSQCFRKEAGSHGKDTKGIFRVHHFNKVEQFVFCQPELSWDFHEQLIANAEDLFKQLGLAYRIVNVCTGDIGTVAAKKYDLEVWFPAQNRYREVVSCSNCTDYQARRLGIRYGKKDAKPKGFVHTLNSTAIATERVIAAILENYQQADNSVIIPHILQPYIGMKKIEAKFKQPV
jgi:seryl-tRNA synthetase